MVIYAGESNVSVIIDNRNAHEYQIEQSTNGLVKTHTCFIEAREGVEFQVKVFNLAYEKGTKYLYSLYIDGQYVYGSWNGCDPERNNTEVCFHGYPDQIDIGRSIFRAFTFGKMQLTSDASAKKLSSNDLESACTIRLEITRLKRSGPINHVPSQTSYSTLPSSRAVHEDSKPAIWGLEARPGREVHRGPSTRCFCETAPDDTALKHIIIFKYLPHGWLVARGLKESELSGGNEDDDFQVDTQRTERMAARRRAREEAAPAIRNLRVKRELTVKSEATTVRNLNLSGPIDLTNEGDEPVPRRIGDTIVIEDNTEDEEDDY